MMVVWPEMSDWFGDGDEIDLLNEEKRSSTTEEKNNELLGIPEKIE